MSDTQAEIQEVIDENSQNQEEQSGQPIDNSSSENSKESQENQQASKEQKKAEKEAKEVAKTLKKLQLKYNDEEYEEELPFEIPNDPKVVEWMSKQLQLAKLSHNSASEKKALEKEVSVFIEELRKDPRSVLSDPDLNVDLKKLAQEVFEAELEQSKKTPEQIEKEKLEAKLKELEEERKKEKEEFQKKEFERLQEQAFQEYDKSITEALEKSSLPKNDMVVQRVAEYMLLGLQNNIDVKPEDVIPLVEEDVQTYLKQLFEVSPDDVATKLLGKERLDNIRKNNLKKAKEAPQPIKTSIKDTGANVNSKKQKKLSYREFFNNIGKQ